MWIPEDKYEHSNSLRKGWELMTSKRFITKNPEKIYLKA